MKISVIITSYNEAATIVKAISAVAEQLDKLSSSGFDAELIIVSPDKATIGAAGKEIFRHKSLKHVKILQDEGKGKPAALNLAFKHAHGKVIIFTDGDMYIGKNALPSLLSNPRDWTACGGRPVSLDARRTKFGYYSHIFCEAAHQKRLGKSTRSRGTQTPMSGYLYAVKKSSLDKIFPISEEIRAEDAYISQKILQENGKIAYAPEAIAYVHFPKNRQDWLKQKKRSLGGNVQIKSNVTLYKVKRSIWQDFSMVLFPIKFAKNPRELLWSFELYPLRLYLWIKIYLQHATQSYSTGRWETIKSSKK